MSLERTQQLPSPVSAGHSEQFQPPEPNDLACLRHNAESFQTVEPDRPDTEALLFVPVFHTLNDLDRRQSSPHRKQDVQATSMDWKAPDRRISAERGKTLLCFENGDLS